MNVFICLCSRLNKNIGIFLIMISLGKNPDSKLLIFECSILIRISYKKFRIGNNHHQATTTFLKTLMKEVSKNAAVTQWHKLKVKQTVQTAERWLKNTNV